MSQQYNKATANENGVKVISSAKKSTPRPRSKPRPSRQRQKPEFRAETNRSHLKRWLFLFGRGDFKMIAEKSLSTSLKLVHSRGLFEMRGVNIVFWRSGNRLCLFGRFTYSRFIYAPHFVNKLWISNHLRYEVSGYDVHSSLKELRWMAAVNRLKPKVSRIIPGNWGKAGSGWLARLLLSRIARFEREAEFISSSDTFARVSNAKKELGGEERLETVLS